MTWCSCSVELIEPSRTVLQRQKKKLLDGVFSFCDNECMKFLLVVAFLFFSMTSSAYALQITSPVNNDTLTDEFTSFLFQTDNGANQWTLWQPDGSYLCGDSINGYGGGANYSMDGWATACGTTINTASTDYHFLLVSARTGNCTSGGSYALCVADALYLGEDVLVIVGTPPPPPPPPPVSTSSIITASSTPHTTADTDFMLSIFLILAFYFFIDDIYYKLFKPHHA